MTETDKTLPPGDVEKVIDDLKDWAELCRDDNDSPGLIMILEKAASLLTTSTEENKRLRVENERLRADLHDECFEHGKVIAQRDASQSQAEAMRAALEEKNALIKYLEASNQGILEHLTKQTKYLNGKISRLREVVEPFAQAADEYDRASSGEPVHGILVPVQDCYAARTALSIKGGESNGR